MKDGLKFKEITVNQERFNTIVDNLNHRMTSLGKDVRQVKYGLIFLGILSTITFIVGILGFHLW